MNGKKTMKKTLKIACFFPGIGYHCDKPLLYYTKKLCKMHGYQTFDIPYGGLRKIPEEEALQKACKKAKKALKKIDFSQYDDILFVGKSIGTIVASETADELSIPARFIYLTPVTESVSVLHENAIAFSGSADPWLKDRTVLETACREKGISLYGCEGGNHSLETGDVFRDIEYLKRVIKKCEEFILKYKD